jgi:hypothetical protein
MLCFEDLDSWIDDVCPFKWRCLQHRLFRRFALTQHGLSRARPFLVSTVQRQPWFGIALPTRTDITAVTLQAPPDCWFYDVWNTNSLVSPGPSGSCYSTGLHDLEVRVAYGDLDLSTPFADVFGSTSLCGSYTGAAAPGALVTVSYGRCEGVAIGPNA